jgi:uncharacterized protein
LPLRSRRDTLSPGAPFRGTPLVKSAIDNRQSSHNGHPSVVKIVPCLSPHPSGCTLLVRVIPRASRSVIAGERDGALLVRIAAPPVEGAANAALVGLVAKALDLPRAAVTIASGERGRLKRLVIAGPTAEAAARRLGGSHSG